MAGPELTGVNVEPPMSPMAELVLQMCQSAEHLEELADQVARLYFSITGDELPPVRPEEDAPDIPPAFLPQATYQLARMRKAAAAIDGLIAELVRTSRG